MAYSADRKPGELTALTTLATDDVVVVGDTSDASEVAKGITKANLITDLTNSFATVAQANATHTGEVTGSGALTVDKTAITGKSAVTAVGTDYVLISDTSDTGNLKKALVSDFGTGSVEGTAILSTGEMGGTKYLREDGDGTSSWQTVTGGGNVSKVGTPVDNQIGVWTGDGTIEGDANLTFQGPQEIFTVGGATPSLVVLSSDASYVEAYAEGDQSYLAVVDTGTGATGSLLELYKLSASPANADVVGNILFSGRDSAGNKQEYGAIQVSIDDATSGSEDSSIFFRTTKAGTSNTRMLLTGASLTPNTNDDIALGGATTAFSDLFLAEGGVINWDNGDATLTQVGDVVTLAGADLKVTTAGNVSTSVVTTDATQTLTNKTLTSPTLTTPSAFTTGGTITLAENHSIALDPAGSADGKYSGITIAGTAGATLAFGDLCYLDPTDSRWELADANAVAAADGDARGILGICVLAAAGDASATTMLLQGVVRADTAFPALTIGAPVYVSETAGDIVVTQPTTTDVVIRIVGVAITADEIFFRPDFTWVTHT